MAYIRKFVPCDEDCEHCKRPADKCKGGSNHKAYDARKKKEQNQRTGVMVMSNTGRRIGRRGVCYGQDGDADE